MLKLGSDPIRRATRMPDVDDADKTDPDSTSSLVPMAQQEFQTAKARLLQGG